MFPTCSMQKPGMITRLKLQSRNRIPLLRQEKTEKRQLQHAPEGFFARRRAKITFFQGDVACFIGKNVSMLFGIKNARYPWE